MRQRHPAGLYVLFFTEMWERFGFYCMESVFVYYMKASQYEFLRENSSRIYGLYLAGVYFTPFFGGLIAESWLGYFASILLGGAFMAGGYFLLSMEPAVCFAIGLGAIIIGNGLFKPNISSLVGKLYPAGDARVDSAFTIFYMGINVGALFAPIAAGITVNLFAQAHGSEILSAWTSYFGAGGLDPFGSSLTSAGSAATMIEASNRAGYLTVFAIAAVGMVVGELIFVLFKHKVHPVQATATTKATGAVSEVPADLQRRRCIALAIFFTINILFWMAFKQRANSMALWIEGRTDRVAAPWLVTVLTTLHLDKLMLKDGLIAKELYQAFNPLYVIILSPLLVWFWGGLRAIRIDVPTPAKLVLGFLLTAGSFAIMWQVAETLPSGERAGSMVIVWFYLVLTLGELCLSPMGLSLVSKLAPVRSRAIWMGLFFVSTSIGGYLSGEVYQRLKHWPVADFFQFLTWSSLGAMVLMICAYPLIAAALKSK